MSILDRIKNAVLPPPNPLACNHLVIARDSEFGPWRVLDAPEMTAQGRRRLHVQHFQEHEASTECLMRNNWGSRQYMNAVMIRIPGIY